MFSANGDTTNRRESEGEGEEFKDKTRQRKKGKQRRKVRQRRNMIQSINLQRIMYARTSYANSLPASLNHVVHYEKDIKLGIFKFI